MAIICFANYEAASALNFHTFFLSTCRILFLEMLLILKQSQTKNLFNNNFAYTFFLCFFFILLLCVYKRWHWATLRADHENQVQCKSINKTDLWPWLWLWNVCECLLKIENTTIFEDYKNAQNYTHTHIYIYSQLYDILKWHEV